MATLVNMTDKQMNLIKARAYVASRLAISDINGTSSHPFTAVDYMESLSDSASQSIANEALAYVYHHDAMHTDVTDWASSHKAMAAFYWKFRHSSNVDDAWQISSAS